MKTKLVTSKRIQGLVLIVIGGLFILFFPDIIVYCAGAAMIAVGLLALAIGGK